MSGIFWGGLPLEVLLLWRDEAVDLVISADILKEFNAKLILAADKFNFKRSVVADWLNFLKAYAIEVEPREHFHLCRDPKDNKFLDAALAGEASYIISGDKDLLVLEEFRGIEIVTPAKFLEIM